MPGGRGGVPAAAWTPRLVGQRTADPAVAEELREHGVEDVGSVRLPLMAAVLGVEELDVREVVLLDVTPFDRREHVVLAVEVDSGNVDAVEPALGREPRRPVLVGPGNDVAVLEQGGPELLMGLQTFGGRQVAHLHQVVRHGFARLDDRLHHPAHTVPGAVVRGEVEGPGRRLDLLRDEVAHVSGDQGEAGDLVGMGQQVVDRVHAAHGVARQVEGVEAERFGEGVDEVDEVLHALGPVLRAGSESPKAGMSGQ